MSALTQLINGHPFDFSSIEFSVNGVSIFNSLQEINYQSARERGELRGTSVVAIGPTRGQESHEGSFGIAKQDERELFSVLAGLGGGGVMDAAFDVVVTYADPSFKAPSVDTLEGCRLNNIDNSHSQGGDPLIVTFDIYISRIRYSGFSTASVLAEGLKSLLP